MDVGDNLKSIISVNKSIALLKKRDRQICYKGRTSTFGGAYLNTDQHLPLKNKDNTPRHNPSGVPPEGEAGGLNSQGDCCEVDLYLYHP